mgnify:CR=1 FL=1
MIQEYQDNLFVITTVKEVFHLEGARHRVQIFRQMGEFEYLSLEPRFRASRCATVVVGETQNEAIQKAKDYLNGQLGIPGF